MALANSLMKSICFPAAELIRMRTTKTGQVIEMDRQRMMALIQTDAELGEILTLAFILRRVEVLKLETSSS